MSAPVRVAHCSSWSAAAARKVSPAASTTLRPSSICRLASLPIVVVLPTPFTPTKSHTGTRPLCARRRDDSIGRERIEEVDAHRAGDAVGRAVRCAGRRGSSFVVATPTSLRSSTSSTTSSCSSLNAPTPESDRTRSKTLRDEPSRCASERDRPSEGRSANSVTRTVGIAARGGAGVSGATASAAATERSARRVRHRARPRPRR